VGRTGALLRGRGRMSFRAHEAQRHGIRAYEACQLRAWWPESPETWIGGRTRCEGHGRHHKTLVVGVVEQRKRRKRTEVVAFRSPRKALPRRGGLYAGLLRLAVIADRSAKSRRIHMGVGPTQHAHHNGRLVRLQPTGQQGLPTHPGCAARLTTNSLRRSSRRWRRAGVSRSATS
jgi:hypothetical protein